MTDFVGVLETYATGLGWYFSYGNTANRNLLRSDTVEGRIYCLLDPVTRVISSSENGGLGEQTFSGSFMLVVKSNLDNNYHNQKGQAKNTGKYEKNILPLLTSLESLKGLIDCSDYEITGWSIVDVINAMDINTDGIIITYSVKTL